MEHYVGTRFSFTLYHNIMRGRLPMNAFIHAGRRGRRSHAYTYMISRDSWVEIGRTMKHGRSRFLTTLAQFHSNRSRLIHGVQFNPFSRLDRRRGRSMEKHRSYREPLVSLHDPPTVWEVSIRRSIIHILNCQSLHGDCHSDWPRGLDGKGQVGLL